MKRKTLKFIVLTISVLVMTLIFAVPTSAETGVSVNTIYQNGTTTITADVPSNTVSISWRCVPGGIVSFGTATRSGNTYTVTATGASLGTATISAIATDSGGNQTAIIIGTIYVVLEDGIYTVRNNYTDTSYTSGGTYYLRAQKDYSTTSTAYVAQHSQNTFGDMNNRIYYHWRIQHIENGEYVILSATQRSALSYSNNSVALNDIPQTVPETSRWYITGDNIIPKSDLTKCLVLATPNPLSTKYDNDTYYCYFNLHVNTISDMAFEKWNFELPTGIFFQNNTTQNLSDAISISKQLGGSDFRVNDLGYTVFALENGVSKSVRWTTSDKSVADPNSYGYIRTYNGGVSDVIAFFQTTDDVRYEVRLTLTIETDHGITNNTDYYIMNYSSGRYLSLETLSNANYTNVYTQPKSSETKSQWKVIKQSGLQYKFVNKYSATSKVMDVTGSNIDIYSDTNGSYQKFEIVRINDSPYKGLYFIRYGSYYVSEDSNHNVYISSTFSSNSVWSFMEVEKGSADLYGFVYTIGSNLNTTEQFDDFLSSFSTKGYNSYCGQNKSPTEIYNKMKTSQIFVFYGHGQHQELICLYNKNGEDVEESITVSDYSLSGATEARLDELDENELSNIRCAILLACNSGSTLTDNPSTAKAIYQKGAHFVMGIDAVIYENTTDLILQYFIEGINNNLSINDTIEHIKRNIDIYYIKPTDSDNDYVGTSTPPFYCIGDTKQFLN